CLSAWPPCHIESWECLEPSSLPVGNAITRRHTKVNRSVKDIAIPDRLPSASRKSDTKELSSSKAGDISLYRADIVTRWILIFSKHISRGLLAAVGNHSGIFALSYLK